MAVYNADNKAFHYMGRIDRAGAEALFIYAGSNVSCKFKGTYVKLRLRNMPMCEYYAVGVVIDGVQYKLELEANGDEQVLTVAEKLPEGEHSFMLFKRMGAAHYFSFISFETDGEILPSDKKYDLKLEYYGDSVSAGEVTEAVFYEGHCDPENHKGFYDNSYFSYTFSLARKLNAEFYNNSQGGLALFDKTGYFCGPELETMKGLEFTYNKMSYVPYAPCGVSDWDFSRYTPDIVIFAIGQNDANPNPKAIFDKEYAEKWKAKYKEIALDIKGKYGSPKFILITTVLMHDPEWDRVIGEIAEELGEGAYHYMFRRNGAATPGHPRITEQEEMALELEKFIREVVLKQE